MTDWNKGREEYRRGVETVTDQAGWTFRRVTARIVLPGMVALGLIGVVGYAFGWCSEAAQVAKEEFGPRAGLKKYEWFIEQSTRIEKMDQDIRLFEARAADVESSYGAWGDRASWPPDVRVAYQRERQTVRDDLVAIVSQRNNLAREYNAASEKFNWSPFNTRGDRPRPRYEEYPIRE